jgi:hypothetical protein
MGTPRRQIIDLLQKEALTALDLSQGRSRIGKRGLPPPDSY